METHEEKVDAIFNNMGEYESRLNQLEFEVARQRVQILGLRSAASSLASAALSSGLLAQSLDAEDEARITQSLDELFKSVRDVFAALEEE